MNKTLNLQITASGVKDIDSTLYMPEISAQKGSKLPLRMASKALKTGADFLIYA